MPLLIRPVKMNKSIYVRVPNDIAHIIGLDNQVEVSFSFEDNENQLRLIYSLDKSRTEQQRVDNSAAVSQASVSPPAIRAIPPHGRRERSGTKTETEGVPAG